MDFIYSTIFYNDSTIYLSQELLGGWGLGTCENWYLKNISIILEEILKNISMEHKNVIFYGSFLCGFNSIMLSILMKDTLSIAEIPQLDVTNGITLKDNENEITKLNTQLDKKNWDHKRKNRCC